MSVFSNQSENVNVEYKHSLCLFMFFFWDRSIYFSSLNALNSLSVVPNNLFIVSIDLSLTISHYMIIQYDEKIYMDVCLTLFQFVLCDGPLLVSKKLMLYLRPTNIW